MNIQEREERFALGVYPSRGISLVRGTDARLWDAQGNEYIDCAAGVGGARESCPIPSKGARNTVFMSRSEPDGGFESSAR